MPQVSSNIDDEADHPCGMYSDNTNQRTGLAAVRSSMQIVGQTEPWNTAHRSVPHSPQFLSPSRSPLTLDGSDHWAQEQSCKANNGIYLIYSNYA
ncbi:hypothetical protein J6590_026872 [Homalodisca vitripennis]|nr:hypothetical protein J6590_026872 [Homalodisca vitripennis]